MVTIIRTLRAMFIDGKKFYYILDGVSYVSWSLYYLLYSSKYTTQEIIEAITFITLVMIVYFAITMFYFRKPKNVRKKRTS